MLVTTYLNKSAKTEIGFESCSVFVYCGLLLQTMNFFKNLSVEDSCSILSSLGFSHQLLDPLSMEGRIEYS